MGKIKKKAIENTTFVCNNYIFFQVYTWHEFLIKPNCNQFKRSGFFLSLVFTSLISTETLTKKKYCWKGF